MGRKKIVIWFAAYCAIQEGVPTTSSRQPVPLSVYTPAFEDISICLINLGKEPVGQRDYDAHATPTWKNKIGRGVLIPLAEVGSAATLKCFCSAKGITCQHYTLRTKLVKCNFRHPGK